ncbi:MAG: membrane dipeptidase [bacterium]
MKTIAGAGAAITGTAPIRAAAGQKSSTQDILVMDAMGEIRLTHERALIQEVIDSGMNAVTVTLCDPKFQEQEAFDVAMTEILAYDRHIRKNADMFVKATKVADVDAARKTGRLALFYYYQNTTQFGRDLDRVDLFYNLGMRSCQLTYNYQNWVGAGCKERTNGGLTVFGVEMVEKMNSLGVRIDLSHANMPTMSDAIDTSKSSVIISHTGCMSVYQNVRSTTDDNMRKCADKGGLVGICQLRPFLTDKKRDNLDEYFRHLKHAIRVAGIEHVCIGSDRDHRVIKDTPEEMALLLQEEGPNFVNNDWPLYMTSLNGPRRMEVVWDGLLKMGLAQADAEKVIGLNLYHLYKDVIG